jgi:ankyrin repeat protein
MESLDKNLLQSFLADDYASVDGLLRENPALRPRLNESKLECSMPPLAAAKSRQMVDVLIQHGAHLEQVAEWWSPGFNAHEIDPFIAQYLVERGARVSIHAAVAIGWSDLVEEMLEQNPQLIRAKGGDGCHPLHFCRDPELAERLLERGADIDARDDDHNSTPAQWRIGDSPDVTTFLMSQGAATDIFMAAGLGDLELVKRLVAEQPECTGYRIGNNKGPFPGLGFQSRGGTIYQWSLGFNLSPHEVALQRGYHDIYDFLMDKSPPKARFLVACTTANRPLAEALAAEHSGLVNELDEEDQSLLAKFCWETNKDFEAVRLMLDLGFSVDVIERNHGYTALHNAAWCGDLDLVRLLLERGHPTNVVDPRYNSTPIGYAIHSCLEAKRHPDGRFAEVIELLLAHGTPFDPGRYPVGHEGIDRVIRKHLNLTKDDSD